MQKTLILIKSSLSFLSFIDYVFGVASKNSWSAEGHDKYRLCFLLEIVKF